MAYMGSEAYDFSLFEPKVIEQPKRSSASDKNNVRRGYSAGNAAPKRQNTPARKTEVKKNNVVKLVNEHQKTIEREALTAVVPSSVKKAIAFAC